MTDEEVVDKIRQGDTRAWSIIYYKYIKLVYKYAYKITLNEQDAEDLAQEIFLHVFKNLHTYNKKYKFFSWLFVNIKYRSIDHSKKLEKYAVDSLDTWDGAAFRSRLLKDVKEDVEEQFTKQEQREKLEEAITKLTPIYAQLVRMRFIEELSYKEMVEKTGMDYFTVKQMTYVGRNNLSRVLKNKERPKVEKGYDKESRAREYRNQKLNGIVRTTRDNKKRIKTTEQDTYTRKEEAV